MCSFWSLHTACVVCVCMGGYLQVQLPPPIQIRYCWSYQLGPLISVISLAVGSKGLIGADGLQSTRPLGPFTFRNKFVSLLIGHINHFGPNSAIPLFAVALRLVISIGANGGCGKT